MLINILILIASFALLIKSADFLVDGASSIAKKLGISTIVIGLTIVAFGTSAPELIVNLFSSFKGTNEITLGNIIGSNICNILLILGVAAVISNLPAPKSTTWKEIPFAIFAVLAVIIIANDKFIDQSSFSIISRIDGIILLGFFGLFLYYIFTLTKKKTEADEPKIKPLKGWIATAMIIGGLTGLAIGGKLVVDSAVALAQQFGVSEALIGLTIVALGTSLPELATSAVAAYKKQSHIAIGNIVGSNIFNIFWVLGLSAVVSPINFSPAFNTDLLLCLFVSLLLFIFMIIGKRHTLQRWQGVMFLLSYVAYIGFLFWRG